MSRVDKGWRVWVHAPGDGSMFQIHTFATRRAARAFANKIETNIFLRGWQAQAYNIFGSKA